MSVKKNLVYNMLLSVSNMIFPIITFPYISRTLGPDGTGLVNFSQSFCQYFIMLAALGIPLYGIREIAKAKNDPGKRNKAFLEIFIIRIVTTFLVMAIYFVIVFSVRKFSEHLVLYIWGGVFILVNINSIEWFFTGMENFRYVTMRSVAVKIASMGLLFIFVRGRNDIIPCFLVTVFSFVANGFINLWSAYKLIDLRAIEGRLEYKKHLKPLTYIFGSFLAINVYTLMDTIILGFISGDKAVGLYSAAFKISKISLTVITSLGLVLIPRMSFAVSENNHASVAQLLHKSVNFVFTFGIPMLAGIYLLAPELVLLFSGKEFLPAIAGTRLLCPVILIIGLANIFSVQILTPLSKDKLVFLSAVAGAVVSLALNFLLIPRFSQNGAAVTNVCAEGTVCLLTYFLAKKYFPVRLPLKEFLLNVLTVAPYALLAFIFRNIFSKPFLVLFFTGTSAFVLFIISQLYILKNPLAKDVLAMLKVRLPGGKKYLAH